MQTIFVQVKCELGQAYQVAQSLVDVDGVSEVFSCLLYTSPSPRDKRQSRMPSSA